MKKHILRYIKRNAIVIYGITSFLLILFLVTALFAKTNAAILMEMLLFVIVMSSSIFIYTLFPIIRFIKMIRRQESMYGKFNENNERCIDKRELKFSTDDWLICSGTHAFYYKYIKSYEIAEDDTHGYFRLFFATEDKEYPVWFRDEEALIDFKHWFKNKISTEVI